MAVHSWARMAAKGLACLFVVGLSQRDSVKNIFEYGYHIHKYEDRCSYFEKDPHYLKKGTVLGKAEDLPVEVPVLRELPGGAIYLCKVLYCKRA